MSRAQSPSREQTLTLNILVEQLLKVTDAVQAFRNQMNNLQINPSGKRFLEAISATVQSENPEILINTYDKVIMYLIPEFDGLNVESFIGHIQVAVKRLIIIQHELLLCGIIAQKLIERAKDIVRINATLNSTAFRKIEISVRKSSKSHCTESTKRHVYPTI